MSLINYITSPYDTKYVVAYTRYVTAFFKTAMDVYYCNALLIRYNSFNFCFAANNVTVFTTSKKVDY